MSLPIAIVKHVDPKHGYQIRVNPKNFWKRVIEKMTTNLTGTDDEIKQSLIRLAKGPEFAVDEIQRYEIATNMDGSPVNNDLNPLDFSRLVVHFLLHRTDYRERDTFFSRVLLEEAGIIPKKTT
jgi:hypothetical protein